MIHAFSPPVRRIVAGGILLLVLLLAGNLLASLATAVTGAIEELEDRRSQTARLVAFAQRPPAPVGTDVPEDLLFRSASLSAAQAEFAGRIVEAARNAQITIQPGTTAKAAGSGASLLQVAFAAEGAELSVLSFVSQLEQGRPSIRLSTWKITPTGEPSRLRLEAVAVAAWTRL